MNSWDKIDSASQKFKIYPLKSSKITFLRINAVILRRDGIFFLNLAALQ